MIVPMQRAIVLCLAKDRDEALESLHSLGVLHIDAGETAFSAPSASLRDAENDLAAAEAAMDLVASAPSKCDPLLAGSATPPADLDEAVALSKELAALDSEAGQLAQEHRRVAPLGDFDPALARDLARNGVPLTLFSLPASVSVGERPESPGPAVLRPLGASGPIRFYAMLGDGTPPDGAERIRIPERRLSEIEADRDANEKRRAAILASLAAAAKNRAPLDAALDRLAEARDFAAARDALGTAGPVCWLSGFAPEESADALRAAARQNGWGLLLREPSADETPPTLIRPPRFFRSAPALFSALNVAPGYTESDVSVPFLCYFSLFFAMIVGDGGYGILLLAATLAAARKFRKNPAAKPWITMMTVFSAATVLWGIASNTWFGVSPGFLAHPVSRWLGDPSYRSMMLLCFTIGVSHLMLARIWNALCKLNDTTCLAEFGWAGILFTMYLVANTIVGVFDAFPSWAYGVGGISILLVFCFTVKPSELKTNGAELGMLPLNIMSALGDIISYVRLFAVGLASVKVAENFNNMATGLFAASHPFWLNAVLAVGMVLILLIGHGLNFAMAGLSVLVHAVRLNTLEFSNHKGVSWSGYEFNPFRKRS
jgi:V/A-type H+-transporting ATPase subunit I